MHQGTERNVFFLYELAHIDACTRFIDAHPEMKEEGYLIVPSGLEMEYVLAERGISFRSCREYRPRDISRFELAERWAAEMADGPEWQWFRYRDVSLSQMFYLSIGDYALRLLYYATILENLLTQHPEAQRLIVFPSSHSLASSPAGAVPARGQPLLREQIVAVVACAKLIGAQRGVEVVIPHAPAGAGRARAKTFVPALKRALLEFGITLYNLGIGALRPRGAPRIFASDYWRNISPILSQLPRGELMLFDRTEAFKAGWANLWRHRVRLFNFSSFSTRNRRQARKEALESFTKEWQALRARGLPEYASGAFMLRPLITEAFEELITNVVPQALADIDGAYALLKKLAPDFVFLRASVSLQTHFYILATVARASGIPSLELQHGLENLGPGSYTTRHSAEYIAVYGKAIQDEFVALGYPREKIPIIGSPRFDAYAKETRALERRGDEGFTVLCVGTLVAVESAQDEYDLEDYYVAIASALEKIPNSSVIIKLRPGPARERFYRETIDRIFARVPHTIAQHESPAELFPAVDAVVSYFSTFVLEALQFGKPTVIYSGEPREEAMTRYHFTQYAEMGSLLTAYSQSELEKALSALAHDTALRERLAAHTKTALQKFQQFDGKASERTIELVNRLRHK